MKCKKHQWTVESSGNYSFVGGIVDDNIETAVICANCGAELSDDFQPISNEEYLKSEIIRLENAYSDLERWAGQYIYNYCRGEASMPQIPDFRYG